MTERPEEGQAARTQPSCAVKLCSCNTAKEPSAKPVNTGRKFPLKRIWIFILWATEAIKEFLLRQRTCKSTFQNTQEAGGWSSALEPRHSGPSWATVEESQSLDFNPSRILSLPSDLGSIFFLKMVLVPKSSGFRWNSVCEFSSSREKLLTHSS